MEGIKVIGTVPIEWLHTLSEKDRIAYFRKQLVQDEPVIIHPLFEPGALNPDIAPGLHIRNSLIAVGEAVKGLSIEASKEYYAGNEFLVWWDGLHDFMTDGLCGDEVTVISMVRRIIVRYDPRHHPKRGQNLSIELENLLQFHRAEKITIEILGAGTADGSELETQLIIKEICQVVLRLINYFGSRLTVRKGLEGWMLLHNRSSFELTSYWDAPSLLVQERVQSNGATFTEMMRVQVKRWIEEGSTCEK